MDFKYPIETLTKKIIEIENEITRVKNINPLDVGTNYYYGTKEKNNLIKSLQERIDSYKDAIQCLNRIKYNRNTF